VDLDIGGYRGDNLAVPPPPGETKSGLFRMPGNAVCKLQMSTSRLIAEVSAPDPADGAHSTVYN